MRILIADDDPISRRILGAMLAKGGHEVVEAADGARALEALGAPDAPRLAIVDWMMPVMDGLETCRRVRALKLERQPYLIMLTSRGETCDIIAGLQAGANDYLAKPYDPGELRARVEVGRRVTAIEDQLAERVRELSDAIEQIKTLRGILPICSNCKRIRDDQGYWNQVECYIHSHSEAEFSHGICPDCIRKLYPQFADDLLRDPPRA